jgi:hypothetical protein
MTIMANSFDSDDDLSTAFGPETLAERDMVPEGFSSAEKLITPERNALAGNTIETSECLKAWWDQGLTN